MLTDAQLIAILEAEEAQCEGRSSSVLNEERKKALDYFNGEPFGTEVKGRSQVVSTEVSDTVLWILPSLMRIFTAGDDVVEFEPTGPEDEEAAKQATDYVNWIFTRQNPGAMIIYGLFFDALLQKNGFGKAWWEVREVTDRTERVVSAAAIPAQVAELAQDGFKIDSAKPVEADDEEAQDPRAETPPGPPPMSGMALMPGMPAAGPMPDMPPPQMPGMPPAAPMPAAPMPGAPMLGMPPLMPGAAIPGAPIPGAPMPGMPDMPMAQIPGMLPGVDLGAKYRITASRTRKEGKVRVVNCPPEEILISKRARDMATAPFVAHKTPRTLSSLLADGYDKTKVMQIPADDTSDSMEEIARRTPDLDPTRNESPSVDQSMREHEVTEAYVLVDHDEDGIAERRKVLYGGKVVLENEEWEGPIPIFGGTAIIMPHRVYGKSIADLVMDLQLIKSTLWRQILDNLYLSNNPRNVVSDQVNLDDLLTTRPGGIVRLKNSAIPGAGHVLPLEVPFVAGSSFPMLEYIDSVRENRTGVTRYNQGTDANSLNKTASGINNIMQAANQRIELMARILAETGIKDLFRLILFLVCKHQDKAQVFRLRNKWVEIDPSEWRTQFDVRIDVALGTGNRDQMAAHLTTIGQAQQAIVNLQQGPNGPLVTWEEISNTLRKLAENLGFKNPELFVKSFGPEEAQQWAQDQQGQKSPEQMQAEMEMQLKQMDAQLQGAIDQHKAQSQVAMQAQKTQADIVAQQQKTAADIQTAQIKAAADMQIQREMADVRAKIAMMKAALTASRPVAKSNGRAA